MWHKSQESFWESMIYMIWKLSHAESSTWSWHKDDIRMGKAKECTVVARLPSPFSISFFGIELFDILSSHNAWYAGRDIILKRSLRRDHGTSGLVNSGYLGLLWRPQVAQTVVYLSGCASAGLTQTTQLEPCRSSRAVRSNAFISISKLSKKINVSRVMKHSVKHANNTSNRCLELSWCQMTKWSNITWWVTLNFQLHSRTSQRGANRKHWPWRRVTASKSRLNQGRHFREHSLQVDVELKWIDIGVGFSSMYQWNAMAGTAYRYTRNILLLHEASTLHFSRFTLYHTPFFCPHWLYY